MASSMQGYPDWANQLQYSLSQPFLTHVLCILTISPGADNSTHFVIRQRHASLSKVTALYGATSTQIPIVSPYSKLCGNAHTPCHWGSAHVTQVSTSILTDYDHSDPPLYYSAQRRHLSKCHNNITEWLSTCTILVHAPSSSSRPDQPPRRDASPTTVCRDDSPLMAPCLLFYAANGTHMYGASASLSAPDAFPGLVGTRRSTSRCHLLLAHPREVCAFLVAFYTSRLLADCLVTICWHLMAPNPLDLCSSNRTLPAHGGLFLQLRPYALLQRMATSSL
ncbi:hypothetical protein KP509_30G006200 [Ceratopteris richardii]|uniref:Uncharacterized protein n=1 Tax=Ceratopteris richardii TaxID=49495 RepID=A0A8T2QZH5_CERRI|nr:hypothetical protein KP509_30G006200 [Ceratopteris richardii]